MKICMVGTGSNTIPPVKGVSGIEKYEYFICKEAAKHGHKCTIIDIKPGPSKLDGIKFERVKSIKFRFGKLSLLINEFIFSIFALIRAIKIKKDVDFYHLHTVVVGFIFTIFKFLLNKPIFYSVHNPDWSLKDSEIPLPNRIIKKIEAFVVKHSDFVDTDGPEPQKNLLKIKKGVEFVTNFAEPDFFKINTHTKFRKTHNIDKNTILVSFVGKLTENKGIDVLLKAVHIIKNSFPNIKFVLIGPTTLADNGKNPWEDLVKQYSIKDNIIFMGPVLKQEMIDIHSASDIYVHPSRKEIASSGAVLEAMAQGLPIVATNLPGMEIAVDKSNGMLFPKGDYKELAEDILYLAKNPEIRKRMGIISRKKVEKSFVIAITARKYLDIYRNGLKRIV